VVYISPGKLNTARELIASRNFEASNKPAYVKRVLVLMLAIDFAQGRAEPPADLAALIDDSHIGSGQAGYSDGERINRLLAHAGQAPLTSDGVDWLIAYLQAQPERKVPLEVPEDDESRHQHPNVRRALKHAGITSREDVSAVLGHARFRQNISGGRASDWIGAAAKALRDAGSAEALRQRDADDAQKLNNSARAWR
jgi:hypothetical protein